MAKKAASSKPRFTWRIEVAKDIEDPSHPQDWQTLENVNPGEPTSEVAAKDAADKALDKVSPPHRNNRGFFRAVIEPITV